MKKILFAVIISQIAQSQCLHAQSPNWLWAKNAISGSGSSFSAGVAACADANGNVIATGLFNSSPLSFGSYTLTGTGYHTVFVVKYDPAGNVLWAKSAGGTYNDAGTGVCTDAGGNILVCGRFSSPFITFGSTVLSNYAPGGEDIFIVKYDPAGNVLWAESFGGNMPELPAAISMDATGAFFIAGAFLSDSLVFGNTVLTQAGYYDVFIAKFDATGNPLWAHSAGGNYVDEAMAVSTDASGNAFITGQVSSQSITFGSYVLTGTTGSIYADYFITKYDGSGNVLWAQRTGGPWGEFGNDLSTDANGNVVVAGSFRGDSITLGSFTLYNTTGTDTSDGFIAKYDASGNVLWAKSAAGATWDCATGVSIDAGDNIYIYGGYYSPSVSFGALTLIPPAANCPFSTTCPATFLVEYDPAGNIYCAETVAGAGPVQGTGGGGPGAICTDPFGNIYVTSGFISTTFTLGTITLNLSDDADFFMAKFSCNATGINETDSEVSLPIFPNPFTGDLEISFPSLDGKFPVQIKLFDVPGQEVLSWQYSAKNFRLPISAISNGIYFIQIKTGKETLTKKVIKQ